MSHDHEAVLAVESYGEEPFLPGWLDWGARAVADLWWYASLPLVAIGAWCGWRAGDGRFRLVLALGAVLLVVPLAFFGGARFHVPAVPALAVCVAVALEHQWRSRASGA